jgi:hypothetical protein
MRSSARIHRTQLTNRSISRMSAELIGLRLNDLFDDPVENRPEVRRLST